jgi:integrase
MMTRAGVQRLTVKKILNHADREITAVYDRYEYDKEKQKAMQNWDRTLKAIIT